MRFSHSIAWRILTAQLITAIAVTIIATLVATLVSLNTLQDRQSLELDSFMLERSSRVSGLFSEIQHAQSEALEGLLTRYAQMDGQAADAHFERLFPLREDGTRRSTDAMFDGYTDPSGDYHHGVAAFMNPPSPADEARRRLLVAAYHIVDGAGETLANQIQNIYFFTPHNELVISAASRPSRLMFYRYEAPPEFNLNNAAFTSTVRPDQNPEGRFVCGELSQFVSIQNREALTTGCFTPVRVDDQHIGALGTTIQLGDYFMEALDTPADGPVQRIFFHEDGRLIAHPGIFEGDITQAVVDQLSSDIGLAAIHAAVVAHGQDRGTLTPEQSPWLVSYTKLDGPGWYYATLADRSALTASAWTETFPIIGFGLLGIALQALVLYFLLFYRVIRPIRRLAGQFGDTETRYPGHDDLEDLRSESGEMGDLARTLERQRNQSARALDELESRVSERTAALEKANRAKNEFISNMSHELRTPLNGIFGLAQALETNLTDEKSRALAGMIKSSGETLTLLLNDILDMSKIEADRLELSLKAENLEQILRDIHALFDKQAQSAGLEFTLEIDESLPGWGLVDALRIRQILSNLISNALKFTQQGSVKITARAEARGKRHWVRMSVEDTGIGMSDSVQSRLFAPFTQANSDTASRFGGTGLGLYISRKLANLMKGELSVSSVEGEGSCFVFEFDMASVKRERDEGAPVTAADLAADPDYAILKDIRILLVEDNAINRQVARAFLKPLSANIVDAENGQVALDTLAETEIDLILMDVRMPVMGGFEATQRIRQAHASHAVLPIVALTANAGEDDAKACFEIGMDAFASKPLTPQLLYDAMKQAIEVRPGNRDALVI